MRNTFLNLILIFVSLTTYCQLGGENTYEFLNLTSSARIAALGGKQISLKDNDLNMTFYNPSVLNSSMNNQSVVNYVDYFTGINYGYVSYANEFKNNNFALGIHYLNYGEFIEADATGQITGNFKASDYAMNIIWAKEIDSVFSFGINIKPIYSSYEKYNSLGIAADLGLTYTNSEKLLSAALVLRNIGTQITTYTRDNREPIPFEIQLGLSKKLLHAPFRFSLLVQHLENFDYTYEINKKEESSSDIFEVYQKKESKIEKFADKAFRHLIMGVEFLPTKSFVFRLGYNYQRRKELQIDNKPGTVGFSWGFGIITSKFSLNFGRATYHLAGASNHFSITTNFSEFYKHKN